MNKNTKKIEIVVTIFAYTIVLYLYFLRSNNKIESKVVLLAFYSMFGLRSLYDGICFMKKKKKVESVFFIIISAIILLILIPTTLGFY